MMKSYLLLTIVSLLIYYPANSQTNMDTWQKQKQEEYAKWKKQRLGQSHLPTSPEQESISNFINEGFNGANTSNQNSAQQSSTQPINQNSAGTTISNTTIIYNQGTNVAPQPGKPVEFRIWAVIVGVASYNSIKSLNYTDDDAYKVYAFFKSPEGGALPDEQVKVLIDEEATRQNIANALIDTYSKASDKDVILFYFSGHGADGAFITHEYDGKLKDENGNYQGFLLHKELIHLFENNPARYKYLIADACHSGSSANKGIKSAATEAMDNYYQAFDQSKGGLVMMLSSMGDEVSIEAGGLRQGIFSYNLIQGLKGQADADKNKIVSVTELFDFVETNVKEYTNNKQNPVIAGDYDEKMPIAIVR